MAKHHVHNLRIIGTIEGISFLLLVFIAMPMKRIFDMEAGILAVRYLGWAHGLLFVLYCVALYLAMEAKNWSLKKSFALFIAALLPFGPFIADRYIKPEDETL